MSLDMDEMDRVLDDPDRLAAADRALAQPLPGGVKELTDRLAEQVGVPYAAVTVLDARRQNVLTSNLGPTVCDRDSSHCQYVVGTGKALAINNVEAAGLWRRLARNLIGDVPLQAYLGVPLLTRYAGRELALGAVCVVDVQSRRWTAEDHLLVTQTAWAVAELMQKEGP